MFKALIAILRLSLIGNNNKGVNNQEEDPSSGYHPFRRGSIRNMITSLSSFAGGSNANEGYSIDGSGHLTTNTIFNQQITVPMPKIIEPIKETFIEDPYNRNIPSLTLSHSNGSLNDHHLAFCLFEVCLGLREFFIQKGNLPVKERRKNPDLPISLIDYHDWFLGAFTVWINVTAKQVFTYMLNGFEVFLTNTFMLNQKEILTIRYYTLNVTKLLGAKKGKEGC